MSVRVNHLCRLKEIIRCTQNLKLLEMMESKLAVKGLRKYHRQLMILHNQRVLEEILKIQLLAPL